MRGPVIDWNLSVREKIPCKVVDLDSKSDAKHLGAVQTLHKRLRECLECMGVGVNMQRNDSVAEEGGAAVQGTTVIKDLGDVRYCLIPSWHYTQHYETLVARVLLCRRVAMPLRLWYCGGVNASNFIGNQEEQKVGANSKPVNSGSLNGAAQAIRCGDIDAWMLVDRQSKIQSAILSASGNGCAGVS